MDTNSTLNDHIAVFIEAEKFEACRRAKFPLCLQRSLERMFSDKEVAMSAAAYEGFKNRDVSDQKDVWAFYLELLSSLSRAFGRDVLVTIETQDLEEMESMMCTKCPLYELEMKRKMEEYRNPLPGIPEFLENSTKKSQNRIE